MLKIVLKTFALMLFFCAASCSIMVPSVRDESHRPGLMVSKPAEDFEQQTGGDDVETSPQGVNEQAVPAQTLEQRESEFNHQLSSLMRHDSQAEIVTPVGDKKSTSLTSSQDVSFHFDKADLVEIVQLFMQQFLKESFIIHSGVQGQVTMEVDDQLSIPQIEKLLEGILQLNNMTMYFEDNRWHILPLADAPLALNSHSLLTPNQQPILRGQQIKAFRLQYVAIAELVKILTPYLSKGAQLYAHESTGIVLLCDYPHVFNKVSKLITLFDVGPFAGMNMKVYWPKYVVVDDLVQELDALANSVSLNASSGSNPNSALSFLALPRLNVLLTMSHSLESIHFVDTWIKELDREIPPVLQDNEEQVFVYSVENGMAVDIVEVLKGLFVSGERNAKIKDKEDSADKGKIITRLTSGLEKPKSEARIHPDAVSGSLSGQVTFVVDEINNTILVRSSTADYHKMLPVMKKLDTYPKQALIEVTIAEIQLDETTKLGIEWQYLMNNVAGTVASGSLGIDSGLGVINGSGESLIGSGLSYMLVNTDRFTAALKAFSNQNRVNILSSPHILASDNQEAKIDIGDEVPIVTSEYRTTETASTATSVDKTIQYRDVGILLSVTPRIHDNGMVRMEVSQEVSEIANKTVEGVNSPVFSKRTAETTLSVKDGQTIVIAGLMQQTMSKNYSGVPFIGRIPLFRYLFGYEGHTFENTELMIFITPHVILNEQDSNFISQGFIERLQFVRQAVNF